MISYSIGQDDTFCREELLSFIYGTLGERRNTNPIYISGFAKISDAYLNYINNTFGTDIKFEDDTLLSMRTENIFPWDVSSALYMIKYSTGIGMKNVKRHTTVGRKMNEHMQKPLLVNSIGCLEFNSRADSFMFYLKHKNLLDSVLHNGFSQNPERRNGIFNYLNCYLRPLINQRGIDFFKSILNREKCLTMGGSKRTKARTFLFFFGASFEVNILDLNLDFVTE